MVLWEFMEKSLIYILEESSSGEEPLALKKSLNMSNMNIILSNNLTPKTPSLINYVMNIGLIGMKKNPKLLKD